MESLYQKLSKKLDALDSQNSEHNNRQNKPNFQSRLINLTDIKLTKEQIQTLSLGPSYAIEKEPKWYINKLIVDMEHAIRHLEPKLQNTYQHLVGKQIKHIITTGRHNTLHKRHQHNINQLKKILKDNNSTIVKADKTKAKVIINKENLSTKVHNFIKENQIEQPKQRPH